MCLASRITLAALVNHGTMSSFRFFTSGHYGLAGSGECQANNVISCVLVKKESRSGSWQQHGLFYCWGHRHVYISSLSCTSYRKRLVEHLFLYTTSLVVQPLNQLPCNAVVGSIPLCLIQHHRPPFWFGMFGCLLSWHHMRRKCVARKF